MEFDYYRDCIYVKKCSIYSLSLFSQFVVTSLLQTKQQQNIYALCTLLSQIVSCEIL